MKPSAIRLSDEQLLKGLKASEPFAYEALVRQFHSPMKQFAMRMIDEFSAEECVQEAFLAVVRKIDSFQGRSSLKTWLLAITANQVKTRLRKTVRETSLDTLVSDGGFPDELFTEDGHWATPPFESKAGSPEELMSYEAFRKCLDKTLLKLPENQRSAIELTDFTGIPLEAVSDILGLSSSNVRVLIHRGRAAIYKMVERFQQTGEC